MPHKDGFKPVVSIVVPTWNQSALTVKCFASIRAHTKTAYEIIWIDNGSNPDEFSIIRSQATRPRVHTKLVKYQNNVGFIKATNAGIREAEGEYIILLNNDCQVTHRWEKKLLKPLQEKNVGAVGPVTQSKIAWQCAEHLNRRWELKLPLFTNDVEKYAKQLDRRFYGRYIDIGSLPLAFFCVAMKKETFTKIGLLDEDFGIGLGDDDEYCMRLRANGYKQMLSLDTFIYHKHRTTFNAMGLSVDSIRRKNVQVLKAKERLLAKKKKSK